MEFIVSKHKENVPIFPARDAQMSRGSLLGGMGAFANQGRSISMLSTGVQL
jgi:hypothetical protein